MHIVRMEWMHSSNILILILLCEMLLVSGSCPKCPSDRRQEGCKCACKKNQYLRQKSAGEYKCEVCTEPCSAAKYLVEVKACGNFTNRVCKCTKGYYCSEPLNHSCLVRCTPCRHGTFSSETSLEKHCKPYTDCKGLGVVTEGTTTQDRVCVTSTTIKAPSGLTSSHSTSHSAEPRIPYSSSTATEDITKVEHLHTTLDSATSVVPNITLDELSSTPLTAYPGLPVSSAIITALTTNRRVTHRTPRTLNSRYVTTGDHSSLSSDHSLDSTTTEDKRSSASSNPSNHPWLSVLLLLLVVSVLVGCFLWLKGKALKKQLKWSRGLPFGKYQMTKKEAGGYSVFAPPPQQPQPHAGNPCLERLIPLSMESGAQMREDERGGSAAQPHPGQGSTQHVTMDNSGRGESISNTVGSIFIYSPGMVVLGTNASERREEMRQEGMERHLSSVPQQESRSTSSSSYPDSVGLSTQEEDEDKELSYPIPASGK